MQIMSLREVSCWEKREIKFLWKLLQDAPSIIWVLICMEREWKRPFYDDDINEENTGSKYSFEI